MLRLRKYKISTITLTASPAPIVICGFADAWPYPARARTAPASGSGHEWPDVHAARVRGFKRMLVFVGMQPARPFWDVSARHSKAFSAGYVGISLSAQSEIALKRTKKEGHHSAQ